MYIYNIDMDKETSTLKERIKKIVAFKKKQNKILCQMMGITEEELERL